jgi:hypothetical protein
MADINTEKKLREKRSYLETEVAESLASGSMFSIYPALSSAVSTAHGEGNVVVINKRIDNRSSLPHKKRRPLPEEDKQSLVGSTINLLRQRDVGDEQAALGLCSTVGTRYSSLEGESPPASKRLLPLSRTVHVVSTAPPPPVTSVRDRGATLSAFPELRGTKPMSVSAKKKNVEAAWMHRLYPFDGPTIEEFTPIFNDVDADRLVEDKLASLRDRGLAQAIKSYYGTLEMCYRSPA